MKNLISAAVLYLCVAGSMTVGLGQAQQPKGSLESRKQSGASSKTSRETDATAKTEAPGAKENGGTTTPGPSLTETYRVGAGDILDIRILNSVNAGRSTLFTVVAGGIIDLPVAGGQLLVSGLTTDDIQSLIATELKRRAVNDNPQVSVGVRQYLSHSALVTGLVASPGTHILRREAVPLYVVLAESQPRNDAGRVVIMRNGSSQTIDLNDQRALNTTVLNGDVITVAMRPQEFYYIAGKINNPGQKTFQPGITLLQAILAAGGTSNQKENLIEISREGDDGRLVTTRFNLKEIKSGATEDPKLQAGDRIQVIR